MSDKNDFAAHHLTMLDHVLAVNRNEWRWLHDEEGWEKTHSFPEVVTRRYGRGDVFRRDRGRMLALGYRILSLDPPYDASTPHEMKVTYQRLDPPDAP